MSQIAISIKQSAQDVFLRAKQLIEDGGGHIAGNSQYGEFDISGVSGTYVIENNELLITIKKRPFLVPMAVIRAKILKYFS